MRTSQFFLTSILLTTLVIQAEEVSGYTPEWLAHKSSVIVIAKQVEVKHTKGPGQVWFIKTKFEIQETIKGPNSKGDRITIYDYIYNKNNKNNKNNKTRNKSPKLVFATVAVNRFKSINGKHILTERHTFKSLYPTDKPISKLFTRGFKSLTKYKDLLSHTRKQVEFERELYKNYWGTLQ
ncbi:hypothetical protein [Candidatus Uabimicrobium sp. HlEnr_7]|uniref:hypothetical protein n=1 Tax=Candidatus Uabimicrobium helgolandensis TaxID=3095367 RepID=UPI003555DAA6